LAPGWVNTAMAEKPLKMGLLVKSDFIPMNIVVDAYMRLVCNSTISGKYGGAPAQCDLTHLIRGGDAHSYPPSQAI
jgi:hypothetical protein